MRTCTTCKIERQIEDFHRKKGEERHRQCKFCKRVAIKAAYERNKAPYIKRAKACNERRRAEFREMVDRIKNCPCADCRRSFPPYVMDFDHRDGSEKLGDVGTMTTAGRSERKLLDEIAKCDVVCANCHRIRTHERRQNTTGGLVPRSGS